MAKGVLFNLFQLNMFCVNHFHEAVYWSSMCLFMIIQFNLMPTVRAGCIGLVRVRA